MQTLISWKKPSEIADLATRCSTPLSLSTTYSSIISRAKMKTVKLTSLVIVCYILSSTPFIVGQIIAVFGRSHLAVKLGQFL